MSLDADAMSAPPATVAPLPWTGVLYWSVRRELWENRAVYLAPAAAAGLGIFGFLFSLRRLPGALRAINWAARQPAFSGPNADVKAVEKLALSPALPYDIVTGVIFLTALIVGVFYCLAALHGERRDRSILFWKSLPVSDTTTVLSKLAVPLIVLPLVVFAVAIPTQLIMLLLSTLVLLANGMSPADLWPHLHLVNIWLTLPYGLVVLALWYVPVMGWLMLVSAWARSMPILWALGPPLGLALLDFLAFHSQGAWLLLRYRLEGGFHEAFTVGGQGKVPIDGLQDADFLRFLALPGLWTGLLFGAACIAGCIWLRRRRDPI
jgi:ABC-2 type transport system permease protein